MYSVQKMEPYMLIEVLALETNPNKRLMCKVESNVESKARKISSAVEEMRAPRGACE